MRCVNDISLEIYEPISSQPRVLWRSCTNLLHGLLENSRRQRRLLFLFFLVFALFFYSVL